KESFESGFEVTPLIKGRFSYPGVITQEPSKVISGKSSVLGESPDTEEWSEFLQTDISKLQLEPNTTYNISFNYKINRLSNNKEGEFYFLARSSEAYLFGDKGFTQWTGEVGKVTNKTISITTGNLSTYY
ncbi:hypothetical protein, partial [Paenibacillus pseudetheri]|uniref:hypothetical protein n=1 Tax=Paenibacillus pseudetheri TaxID=2897682 RepID=UPI001F206ACD